MPPAASEDTSGRVRAWLVAAVVVLLVSLFLVVWTTWTQLHLPPRRYAALTPGATATQHGVEFRLLSLRTTASLGDQYEGPTSPPPDSVWVVADLEATARTSEQPLCDLQLVDDERRSWVEPSVTLLPSRAQEDCLPDDARIGQAYQVERIYLVPTDALAHLAGIAVDRFDVGALSLLTPPPG